MARTEIARTAIKPRKSRAKSEYDAELDAITPELVKRSGGMCELRIEGICELSACRRHHRLMRSQSGPNTLSNLLHLCLACHHRVHHPTRKFPNASYSLGWLVPMDTDPASTPCFRLRNAGAGLVDGTTVYYRMPIVLDWIERRQ